MLQRLCQYTCRYAYAYTNTYTHFHSYTHIHSQTHTPTHIHNHTHTYTSTSPHTFSRTCTTNIHTCIHTPHRHTYICICYVRTTCACVRPRPYPAGLTRDRPLYCCSGPVDRPAGRLAGIASTGRSPGRPRRHRLAVQVARWCRAGVAARPERRGGIQQISPAGEVSPSSPRAGTVISQLRHRPGLAGRAARLKHLRKMRWQCEMVMWLGVGDVFARICTV